MAKEFEAAAPPVPVKPTYLHIGLDVTEGAPRLYTGAFFFRITDATGGVLEERRGDLDPHLTAAIRAKVKDLLDFALDKARTTVP